MTDPDARKAIEAQTVGLTYLGEHWVRQIRNAEAEYHMRPALAVGCLVFAVIGCPVGMWANRADYLSAFVTCFLPTVCVYYPLLAGRVEHGPGRRRCRWPSGCTRRTRSSGSWQWC